MSESRFRMIPLGTVRIGHVKCVLTVTLLGESTESLFVVGSSINVNSVNVRFADP